jgi:hypothetical protein
MPVAPAHGAAESAGGRDYFDDEDMAFISAQAKKGGSRFWCVPAATTHCARCCHRCWLPLGHVCAAQPLPPSLVARVVAA